MSVLDFELFNLKDMFGKALDNPEQLLLGAATPVGAALWGGLLGKDYDPLVNVFGGPMGGDSLGIGSGGVYDRAQEAGVSTNDARNIHDAAEVIAGYQALVGGGGAGGGGGGAGGSAAGVNAGINSGVGAVSGGGGSALGGSSAAVGTTSGGGLFSGLGATDYLDMAGQVGGLLGGGQQEQPRPAPAFNQAGPGTSEQGFKPVQLGSTQPQPTINSSVNKFMSPQGSIQDLIGGGQGQELASQVRAEDKPSGFGAFFDNLDKNLQSPSKQIGLALLSQIDPRLAQAGLLAGGFFGENNVFGGQ